MKEYYFQISCSHPVTGKDGIYKAMVRSANIEAARAKVRNYYGFLAEIEEISEPKLGDLKEFNYLC